MKKRLAGIVAVTAVAVGLTVGSGSAVAQDAFNKNTCEQAGGTWTSNGSTKTCVFPEEEGKNDNFQCQETVTGGPGNLKPQKDTEETETTDDTGSGKCPPGQFPA
jgi:hypothetical protein